MSRVGIMGGTFDPIHLAHLVCAEEVLRSLELDKVVFMPAGDPHFKQGKVVASPAKRLHMVELACKGNPHFDVSDLEIRRQGITYTVDTLEQLHRENPDDSLFFILGADALAGIGSWYGSGRLPSLATYVVIPRPGYDVSTLAEQARGFTIEVCEVPSMDLSSTMVRNRIAQGKSVHYLVPDAVRVYLEDTGLYAGGRRSSDEEGAVSGRLIASAEQAVRERLSGKRLMHSFGAAHTARALAEAYGVDGDIAYLAGLLHDWDKCIPNDRAVERAEELGIPLKKAMRATPSVLHGLTASKALPDELFDLPQEILDAIARHTIPVMEMRPLDKIVYIADKIEPSRPIEHTRAVRERIGISSLHELYLQTFASSLAWLIETRRPVYTGSIKVWNALMRQG
jgi:nicotinate (nicotinamide) nucleotide adenylyltransferase